MKLASTGVVVGMLLGMALGPMAFADEKEVNKPGHLHRFVSAGSYTVGEGDVIEIAVASNPSTGPNNTASNLKVKVKGDNVKKFGIVYVPPTNPIPGAPGEVRAYLGAEDEGEATVKVIPINGMGKEGKPLVFKFQIKEQD